MWLKTAEGILIPFAGTGLGAACVFFLKERMSDRTNRILSGFAAGIMVSASFFSLILPALEQCGSMGRLAFVPAVTGFLVGMGFLLLLDVLIPHIHPDSSEEGPQSGLKKTAKLALAVTLHNLPEGMAVGVAFAVALSSPDLAVSASFVLSVGITLQNFPEGAIISMPLSAGGMKKGKSFFWGMMSGLIEPVGALLSLLLTHFVQGLLPYVLSFAAGAMLYVVSQELIPSLAGEKGNGAGLWSVAAGFALMMLMDVALG